MPKKNNLIPPSTPGQPGALLLQVMDTSSRVALMAALEDSAGLCGKEGILPPLQQATVWLMHLSHLSPPCPLQYPQKPTRSRRVPVLHDPTLSLPPHRTQPRSLQPPLPKTATSSPRPQNPISACSSGAEPRDAPHPSCASQLLDDSRAGGPRGGDKHGYVCVWGEGPQALFPTTTTPFLGGEARRKVAGVPRGPPGTCRGAGAAARCRVSPVRGRGRWLGFGRRCERVELLPDGAGGDGGSRSFCAECQTFPWLPFLHPRHPFPLPRTHMHTPPANGLLGVCVCVCVAVCACGCMSASPASHPLLLLPEPGIAPATGQYSGWHFAP